MAKTVARIDRLMRPLHRWVWRDHDRRLRKLLAFADVETDGGRDKEPARGPFGRADRRTELRDALRERPHRADIQHAGTQHVAALQFGEQVPAHGSGAAWVFLPQAFVAARSTVFP